MNLMVKQIEWAINGMELFHVEGEGRSTGEGLLEDWLNENGVAISRTPTGTNWSYKTRANRPA